VPPGVVGIGFWYNEYLVRITLLFRHVQKCPSVHAMNFEFDQFHTEKASALLRAMGNPQRLRILLLLAERERSVIELEALVGLSQSAVSQHLGRLRQIKLVRFRRDGQMTFYALDGAEVHSILMTLHLLYGRDKNSAAITPSSQPGIRVEADPSD
jgi:ArsR family transcriptional regulator, virulence genes transcriptional regulator